MDGSVLELVKRSAAIPSMPQVATRFLELIQDPDSEFKDVAVVLSTDPGTASEILRLANSSLFGVTRQVTSLTQALSLLGLKRVRSLVLGRYIVDSLDRKGLRTIERSYYWQRSLITAILSARLADVMQPRYREEAFIAGLLADVGIVILDDALGEQYEPIASNYRPQGKTSLACDEQTLLGISHGQASALVLDHWQLPEIVCEAVRRHSWELLDDPEEPLCLVVGAADRLSKYFCETPERLDIVADDGRTILDRLHIDPATFGEILQGIEQQIEELASVLRIDVLGSNVYQLVADAMRKPFVETA